MNFGMLSPGSGRGGGAGRGGGGGGAQPIASPRETVHAQVLTNKIVGVELPYGTPRASNIRQFTQSRILTPLGVRALVWRRETNNKWTNIALSSTPENPVLTMEPVELCQLLTTVMPTSPDVAAVVLHDANNAVITMDQVTQMQFQDISENVVPVPPAQVADEPTFAQVMQSVTDTYEKVEEVAAAHKSDVIQLKTSMEQKLNYIIDLLEGRARNVDPARRLFDAGPDEEPSVEEVEERDEQAEDTDANGGDGGPELGRGRRRRTR